MTRPRKTRSTRWKYISCVLLLQAFGLCLLSQVNVSGKVTDAEGKGVPGISVSILNTSYATSTDASGAYNLSANLRTGSYQLQFTGVGYKSQTQMLQIVSATSYTADAQLVVDPLKMEEVVVTGTSIGTTRKQLGNYISTVKADELTKGATSNVLAALQGKTAGAQIIQNNGDPAGGVSVRLRGVSSILSSSEPLYIVDGVIVNNGTNRVTNTQNSYDGTTFVGTIGQTG